MKKEFKIFSILQEPGDFVITLPKAYNTDFAHGYNVSETVNIWTADYLIEGRNLAKLGSTLKRFCGFSYEEIVFKILDNPDGAVYKSSQIVSKIQAVIQGERQHRQTVEKVEIKVEVLILTYLFAVY